MEKNFRKITAGTPAGIDLTGIPYHSTLLRIPLFEVDLGGAVYHGNYFHIFEHAREDFLNSIGFPYSELMSRQLHLTVVDASCSYRKPLLYNDLIEVRTAVTTVRKRGIGFSQTIFKSNGRSEKELCTRVHLMMVCVSFSGRPTILPEDFREKIEAFLGKALP